MLLGLRICAHERDADGRETIPTATIGPGPLFDSPRVGEAGLRIGLALTKREFASVRSGGEAANLIHVIVASAPAVQIPPLVTAAVEANPQYGQEVVQAAIEGASPSERAAIVTSVYFALSQNPSTPKPLLDYVSDLVHGHSVPTNSAGTIPWFNTGASVGHNKG